MGINASDAKMLRLFMLALGCEGRCLTLGRQDIEFGRDEWVDICRSLEIEKSADAVVGEYHRPVHYLSKPEEALCDQQFFADLGFKQLDSVDASNFEGADICFDLNQPGLVSLIDQPYDLIYESGTMEHVFHLPNYLANLVDSLKVGGLIVQRLPVNNYVDHGFYQISPTLLEGYYRANKFKLEALQLIISEDPRSNVSQWRPYIPGEFDTVNKDKLGKHYLSVLVVARKTSESTCAVIPQQRVYRQDLNWTLGLSSTKLSDLPVAETLNGPFKKGAGYCWMVPLNDPSLYGDSPSDTRCSRLVLLEDDQVIGEAHALHDDVRMKGGGLYSHWEGVLYFSTPDASDPNLNGKVYTVKTIV